MTQMMRRPRNDNGNICDSCLRKPIATSFAILGVFTIMWIWMGGNNGGGMTTIKRSKIVTRPIQSGTMPDSYIPYYQCLTADEPSSSSIHLILLHGSKFTKEDWKTSGILSQFCSIPGWTVTAFDLDVSADHRVFQALLSEYQRTMKYRNKLNVITPSASGRVFTDWIMNGNAREIPNFVQTWIPVAAGSVHSLSDEQLQHIPKELDILAIYGDQDPRMGKDTSIKLQQWARATSVELKGRHPVYLDSPDEFVKVIRKHLAGE